MTRKLSTREIYEHNKGRIVPPNFEKTVIWLHNIRSMHNVGSVFRTADAFGISHVLLSGYTPSPPRPEISKTALGADETVAWSYLEDMSDCLEWLRKHNYYLVGLEQMQDSVPINEIPSDIPLPLCLIAGNEVTGIDESLLPHIDLFTEIPQYGNKHSLNVSVAVGVALFALHEFHRLSVDN